MKTLNPLATPRDLRWFLLIGAISLGQLLLLVFLMVIGLAFFTVVPPFVESAVGTINVTGAAINQSTVDILRLIPFVLGTVFVVAPVAVLIKALRGA